MAIVTETEIQSMLPHGLAFRLVQAAYITRMRKAGIEPESILVDDLNATISLEDQTTLVNYAERLHLRAEFSLFRPRTIEGLQALRTRLNELEEALNIVRPIDVVDGAVVFGEIDPKREAEWRAWLAEQKEEEE